MDDNLLEVRFEQLFDRDEVDLRLISRRFSWRGAVRFTYMEAPPEVEATNIALAAFGPLFRAYDQLPFSEAIVKPLLVATMDRLLPELHRRLAEVARYYIPGRRPRRVLVTDRNPRVENYLVQGNNARILMDQLESAFRHREMHGGVVSLANANVVPEPGEIGSQQVFLQGFGDPRTGRTATETRMRHAALWEEPLREFEAALFFGDHARVNSRGPSADALARARETLIHCLSPVQRAEFARSESFTVAAANGKTFKILKRNNFNVDDGEWEYCCVPADLRCPVYDKMLASKLWLEGDYDTFMRVANRHHKFTGQVISGRQEQRVRTGGWIGALELRNPRTIVAIDTAA